MRNLASSIRLLPGRRGLSHFVQRGSKALSSDPPVPAGRRLPDDSPRHPKRSAGTMPPEMHCGFRRGNCRRIRSDPKYSFPLLFSRCQCCGAFVRRCGRPIIGCLYDRQSDVASSIARKFQFCTQESPLYTVQKVPNEEDAYEIGRGFCLAIRTFASPPARLSRRASARYPSIWSRPTGYV